MKYAVRLVEKEYRKIPEVWVTKDVYHEVVEANSKQLAYKQVRAMYPDTQMYRLGRVSLTDKPVGKNMIPFKELPQHEITKGL